LIISFYFLSKTHYLSQIVATHFAMLIYLVCWTYWDICDRLKVYKDIDLASLSVNKGIGRKYINYHKLLCVKYNEAVIKHFIIFIISMSFKCMHELPFRCYRIFLRHTVKYMCDNVSPFYRQGIITFRPWTKILYAFTKHCRLHTDRMIQ